ncbi:helix-turn-helix transcriptional regulator [Actinoplanes bogorensis]|uniref:Helix-turn-helix transcriptional regulator n=1 Tax=Paractinoplanes bogorensis TaxID=1610840 RepID=A0ABS5Z945_9ACTN|nr:helix-turn-helix transcriptional regulator [Actinoplanes bogorensis]MBU2671025.1 helix-turn-helix transcriptional regulator [Actinoplanes bogorensis]
MIDGDEVDRQAQLLRGTLDMCLLALLSQQPAHGYGLVQRVGEAGFPSVGYGTIYPLLTRMRRLGLVTQDVQDSPHGPARKVYGVTEAGRERLTAWTTQWNEFIDKVDRVVTVDAPATARMQAKATVAETRTQAEATLAEARTQAEATRAEARTQAEATPAEMRSQ